MSDFVSVIDIGSSSVIACVAKRGVNGSFIIKEKKEFLYDGFLSGAFLDEDGFKKTLTDAVNSIIYANKKDIDRIFVSVPGAFIKTDVLSSSVNFDKRTKITLKELDDLYDGAFQLSSSKYSLIDRSPVFYELDDGNIVKNPLGKLTAKIDAKLSFILCNNYFISVISSVFKLFSIEYSFVCSSLAIGRYLIEKDNKELLSLVCDIGYISSTLFVFSGDGIVYQKSFDFGGGYITGAISEKLDVDFDIAESLKSKVNLSAISYKGCYSLIEGSNGNYYSQDEIKSVVIYVLDQLCEDIYDSIKSSPEKIPDFTTLYITGGGISNVRGAKERISERLERNVEMLSSSVPLCEDPKNSSLYALLDYALDKSEK